MAFPTRADRPGVFHQNQRLLVISCLLVISLGVAACSSNGAADPTSSPDASAITDAVPDGFDDGSVEPGTGTEVVLDLPDTAPSGQELRIPLVISAGSEPDPWDNATLQIGTDGPITATADIDPAALMPGTSVEGMLTVHPQSGTADELTTGYVSLTLQLRNGSETTPLRRVEFGVLADDRTTWLGYLTPNLLELDRLRALLDAGEISPNEYEDARTQILETVTGTVDDPTKDQR